MTAHQGKIFQNWLKRMESRKGGIYLKQQNLEMEKVTTKKPKRKGVNARR